LIEVEVKASIKDFQEMKEKLKEINAIKVSKEIQEDIYFEREDIGFARNDMALRIREIKENQRTNTVITYKGPKIDNKTKTREEIELKVEDKDKLKRILERLRFVESGLVKKTREIFKFDDMIISLDDVEGLSPYMEIEIDLKDDSDYQPSIDKIYSLFEKLGVTDGFERTSYLELLENKK